MNSTTEPTVWAQSITAVRVARASAGVSVLTAVAVGRSTITYADFARAIGMKIHYGTQMTAVLDDIARVCDLAGLPNMACMVVYHGSGECSDAYPGDPAEDREQCYLWAAGAGFELV